MNWVHAVRGTYIVVSLLVWATSTWRLRYLQGTDIVAGLALSAYAVSVVASQMYAFNKPLTTGTAYVGLGVVTGFFWLAILAFAGRKNRSHT